MKEKQMDIQLKQAEIESAIRTFVSEKIGINLTGKRLGVNFSMGRGPNNLVANLSIEDASDTQVPGFTDRDAPAQQSAEVVNLPVTGSGENKATTLEAKLPPAAADDADPVLTEKSVPTDTVEADTKAEEKTDAKPATTGGIFS